MLIVPRTYQNEAIKALIEYFYRHPGNPLVAMPTGTGKSIVIAMFLKYIFEQWPHTRVMMLTHVKELIDQNYKKLMEVWPLAPVGIYSAGLERRDHFQPIIFGGVASVVKCIELFGWRDLLIIDEAHLLNPDTSSMYQKIIADLKKLNPQLRVIGLTATWYRTGQGLLTGQGIFTDIAFNICDSDGFARLISEGFLCPPVPKITRTEFDVSDVAWSNGDYIQKQLEAAVDKKDINQSAGYEICEQGQYRRSWLVFCAGVDHAEHMAEVLTNYGAPTVAIHSKLKGKQRDAAIRDYKAGVFRCATNNNVLTTGFDHPPIDLIGAMRPTMSPGLWVQMVGRGMRPYDEGGKMNCEVLDFARNTLRLGPIDDPNIPRPKGEGGTGDAPIKLCPHCGAFNHTRVRYCVGCGAEFDFQSHIVRQADTRQLLSTGMPVVEIFNVDRVMYNRHVSRTSGSVSIKVSYLCGLQKYDEFIGFDASGFARHKSNEWWRQRYEGEPPLSTDMALVQLHNLRTPRRIRVWTNQKYPKVLSYEF